jgi:MFS family permease
MGMLETLMTTFAVLIAIEHFDSKDSVKALLLSISQFGLMASVIIMPVIYARGLRPMTMAGILGTLAALGIVAAALSGERQWLYVTGIGAGFFIFMVQIPLMTQMYQTNYPSEKRGKLFSFVSMARGCFAIAFGIFAGWLLEKNFDNYRMLLWLFAAAALITGLLCFRIPSAPSTKKRVHLLHSFRWLKHDPVFRRLIVCWMFVGTGNLISMRLWVEYLAGDRWGFHCTPGQVALLTLTIPLVIRTSTTYLWGILFDRFNFYINRVLINAIFTAAVLLVYLGGNLWIVGIGMALQGFGFAGGNIMWGLWVTKVAPPDRVGEYMSIHTFFTGIRGAAAPFLGYWMLAHLSPAGLGISCAAMMIISTVVIWPEVRLGPPRKKGESLAPRDPAA